MKALILAAGIGKRLKLNIPKILLKIGSKTLLERHYENLLKLKVKKIAIVIGYKSDELKKAVKKIDVKNKITIFENYNYKNGSIVSLICAEKYFFLKGNLIIMDGDVLYHNKILKKLVQSKKNNCLLLDKNFESGMEPVKVCVKNKEIVDFGKKTKQDFDFQGESVGFFKFSNKSSIELLNFSKKIMKKNKNSMYEDAIQRMIEKNKIKIHFENITNLPWTEIDFRKDLIFAKKNILKKIL
tara:strand:+ start:31 stop:753 length:723 start_codon:yes stop_codon:yes gene_type:complete